jgi:hypothetical protein
MVLKINQALEWFCINLYCVLPNARTSHLKYIRKCTSLSFDHHHHDDHFLHFINCTIPLRIPQRTSSVYIRKEISYRYFSAFCRARFRIHHKQHWGHASKEELISCSFIYSFTHLFGIYWARYCPIWNSMREEDKRVSLFTELTF